MSSTHPAERRFESRPLIWFGVITLALSGLLFFLYPAVRPWHDESTVEGALTSMSSDAWVAAHLFAVFALILMPLGMLALWGLSAGRRGGGLTFAATVITWVGVGLALPYYGAEDFALHVVGQRSLRMGDPALTELGDAFRLHPVAATTFVLGLLLLAVGGVLTAVAISRSGSLPKWSGVPLAAGFVLFFPQFYTPIEVRTAHGALMAIGCVWVGVSAWRARS